jgi:hypothetical protein
MPNSLERRSDARQDDLGATRECAEDKFLKAVVYHRVA